MASTSAWLSPDTSTVAPLPAPSVMISRAELASTGSSPTFPIVTSEPSSAAASEMIAAGRACSPTAEPTVTVLLGMRFSPWVVCRTSPSDSATRGGTLPDLSHGDGLELLELLGGLGAALQRDHASGRDHRADDQRGEEPQGVD